MIAVTETWLSPSVLNNEILPTCFTIYCNDISSRGGGVLLAVHHTVSSRIISSPCLEVVTVEVSSPCCFTMCVVYIPPNSNHTYYSDLFTYLDSVARSPKSIIVGDFNFPDICWSTLSGQSPHSELLCDLVFLHDLFQLVDFPLVIY